MSTPLETIIRPNTDDPSDATRYYTPNQGSNTPIRIKIGFKGSIKTLSLSLSMTQTSKVGQANMENAPAFSAGLAGSLASIDFPV
jgi:hypothetical protein